MSRILAAALFAWGVTLSGIAAAASGKTYTIGVEDLDYYPVYKVESANYSGYARELLDAFAQDRGYRFEYKPLPVNRLFASFFQGQFDFKFPDNPYWQKEQRTGKNITYSSAVIAYIDGAMVRPEMRDATPDKIKTLVTVAGFTPWAWLALIKSQQVTLRENANFTALTQQVIAGRADAAYASIAVVNHQLDHILKTPGALVFNSKLPHSRDYYYLSTLNQPEVIAEFDAWQKKNAKLIRTLKNRYAVEKGVSD